MRQDRAMAFSGPVEDRLLIRELYGAYSVATSRADGEAWLAMWTEDGVRQQDGHEVSGRPALQEFWDMIWGAVEKMAFFSEIGSISVTSDTATARCLTREIISLRDGPTLKIAGLYDDQLRRENDVWRFARRDYEVLLDEGRKVR